MVFRLSCVDDGKLLFCAEFKKKAPVVIAVSHTMFAKYAFPGFGGSAYSGFEVAQNNELVIY